MKRTKKKNKVSFFKKLRHKYRLIIYNDNTFEEVFYVRLSRLNVFILTGIFSLLLIFLNTLIIAYTPLKEFIPGYPSSETMRQIQKNAILVEDLEREVALNQQFINNLKLILTHEVNDTIHSELLFRKDTSINFRDLNFQPSRQDSLLRARVESEDKYSLNVSSNPEISDLNKIIFISPVKGLITNQFNASNNHYGIDIVAKQNEMVLAVNDGIIISSTYTYETGNVLIIQHKDNIISVYKHLSRIIKKQGSRVKAGDAIGVLGNTGVYTSGPHLHFELWYNGNPINPSNFIIF